MRRFLVILLLLAVCGQASAADPVVNVARLGVMFFSPNMTTGETWTAAGKINGSTDAGIPGMFSFSEWGNGAYAFNVTYTKTGHYELTFTSNIGETVSWNEDVQSSPVMTAGIFGNSTSYSYPKFRAIGGAVASVTSPVTVGSNNDKAGYSLVAGGGGAVNLIPFQGSVSYAGPVTSSEPLPFYAGDDVTVPYAVTQRDPNNPAKQIPLDLTGYTLKIAVKRSAADTAYVIKPRDITSTVTPPASKGAGQFTLSHTDTAPLSGNYVLDLVLYSSGGLQSTALRINMMVRRRVIQ